MPKMQGIGSAARLGMVSPLTLVAMMSLVMLVILSLLAISLRPDARRPATNEVVRVYCASSLVEPVKRLIENYERETGGQVELVRAGGSGELAGQLKAEYEIGEAFGADIYVTADDFLLGNLMEEKVIAERYSLGRQRPVIAVAEDSQWQVKDLVDLLRIPDIRFGIASRRAAIGQLTRAIADEHQLGERLEQGKMLDSENVMVLAQALVMNSLDAAVVWDTTVKQINQVNAGRRGNIKIVAMADPNDQAHGRIAVGVLRGTGVASSSHKFCRFMTSSSAQIVFGEFGFATEAVEHRSAAN